MRFKYQHQKPNRDQLWGMSPSQFKTMLRRRGYKIPRDFFKCGSIAKKGNRLYRFRYWGGVGEFFVDVSCHINQFDRWANSVQQTINFYNWWES